MDPRITLAIDRMEAGLKDKLVLTTLAAEVGLSVSRFGYLFRKHTGVSPGTYLQALRMERARLLVERTSLTVREVMTEVGMTDPSHFARDFRKAHGFSPRTFRVQLRVAGPPTPYIARTPATGARADLQADPPTGARTATRGAVCMNDDINQEEKKKWEP